MQKERGRNQEASGWTEDQELAELGKVKQASEKKAGIKNIKKAEDANGINGALRANKEKQVKLT